jgi:DNA-binding CsgD family transcriptional regulator
LGITGIFYARIYPDGSLINLASRPEWFKYYFNQLSLGRYPSKDISDQLFSHEGVSLWALNPDNQVWQEGAQYFGCGNGVSLSDQNDQARDLMGFYSTTTNHAINHFYINQADVLKQFKRHFLLKAAPLIRDAEKYKCQLPPQTFLQNSQALLTPPLSVPELTSFSLDWNTLFELSLSQLDQWLVRQRYPIQLGAMPLTLSRMEIKTLVQLLKGQHSGEIAVALNIKQTTVESYLSNLKNKLGVNLKSELIQTVIHHQLLQQIC